MCIIYLFLSTDAKSIDEGRQDMSDKVLIRNLQCDVLIGVYAFEREAKQRVIFDIDCLVDNRKAGESDDVKDAVDYAQVVGMVEELCDTTQYHLLEALAEHVARDALTRFMALNGIVITLYKPDIMPNDVNVAVQIERLRR